jgi:hypothetical protein
MHTPLRSGLRIEQKDGKIIKHTKHKLASDREDERNIPRSISEDLKIFLGG